jgi:hypothetical protein
VLYRNQDDRRYAKRILAVGGQTVTETAEHITVNGTPLVVEPASGRRRKPTARRPHSISTKRRKGERLARSWAEILTGDDLNRAGLT